MKPVVRKLRSKYARASLLVATALGGLWGCSSESIPAADSGLDSSTLDSQIADASNLDSGLVDARGDSATLDGGFGDGSSDDANANDASDAQIDAGFDAGQTLIPNIWSSAAQTEWNAGGSRFGRGVALSGNGSWLVVGIPNGGTNNVGHVVVLARSGTNWDLNARTNLNAPEGAGDFGSQVSISDDGNVIAVADGEMYRVHIFRKTGGVWDNGTQLPAPGNANYFGLALAISGDGNTVAVGDPYAYNATDGAVFVYRYTGSAWSSAEGMNRPSNNARFGSSVDLSYDGNTLVVGDPEGSTTNDGQAVVYTRSNNVWNPAPAMLMKYLNDDYTGSFGEAVAISGDGRTIAVGDPNGNMSQRGSVFIYTRNENSWTYNLLLEEPAGREDHGSAISMSYDGRALVVVDGSPEGRQANTYVQNNGVWSSPQLLAFPPAIDLFRSVAISADGNTIVIGDPEANSGIVDTYSRTL